MQKVIHLISDLHLCENQPHLLALFKHYMVNIAPLSDELFVLGDLFEVWVGDDHHSSFNQQVIDLFAAYSQQDTKALYFTHGNRDFLLGEQFARACNGKLLDEPHNFQWQNFKISLMHGDSLCTDDLAYQQFRATVRNPDWQSEFLKQPLEARLAYAESVRQQSIAAQQGKQEMIMDVNHQAVINCFRDNQCDWLIHGHTHRENRHTEALNSENADKTGIRIVLSDWQQQGHYLELNKAQAVSHYFELEAAGQ